MVKSSIIKENIGGLIFCIAYVFIVGFITIGNLDSGGGRYFALSLLHIPFGFAAWVIGNIIRKAVHPDFVVTSGFLGLLKEKIFWRVGPQLILSVFVLMFASYITENHVKRSVSAEYARGIMQEFGDYYGGDTGSSFSIGYIDMTKEQFIEIFAQGKEFVEIDIERAPTLIRRGSKYLRVTGHATGELLAELWGARPSETVDTNPSEGLFLDLSGLTGWATTSLDFRNDSGSWKALRFPRAGTDTIILSEEFTMIDRSIDVFSTFSGSEIKNVFIPNTVTRIGNGAFSGCENLTGIVIPQSVTEIGESAFGGCRNLQFVYFSNNPNVKSIGQWAFNECVSLGSAFEIPPGVESVSPVAFSGCNFSSIIFPESIKSIGDGVADGMLQEVTIKAKNPPEIGSRTFPSTINAIYVPAESLKAYEEAWFDFEFTFNNQLKPIR